MTALQLRGASVSVEVGGENRRGSSSCLHAPGGNKHKSSSVSFPRRPLHGRRSAQASVLAMAVAAQAPPHPMSSPSVAACLDPLLQGHHHAIMAAVDKKKRTRWEEKEPVTPEKLEQWMRDSIGEIVKNIEEAPFLVQIFSGGGCGAGREGALRVEREAASPESWPRMSKRWDEERRKPDGVILVEKLTDAEETGAGEEGRATSTPSGPRTWGLVVQGRGMDCASCYILNTSRVRSSMGFCTHFCLVRAKCFGEPFELQLRKAWLQRR
ncbi:uncharacterized protein LOC103720708 [Phoenix dactylifera]|uniref:Uncharacterized protein LOC103720708 n=1 Tax=Phoenix dactylifera TaxID=42345 RepID=A0A8B7CYE3_PHODC|nr:uncharacterized protein LOC103720708 [Phoenix dactylifera]